MTVEIIKTEQKNDQEETIPKKIAAIELARSEHRIFIISLIGITGLFTTALANLITNWIASLIALGFVAINTYFIVKSLQRKKQLNQKYINT